MDLFDLKGRVALVTGATHGLGMAMATGLGKAGATLVINGHSSQEKLDAAIETYESQGLRAHGYLFDVTDEDAVEAAVERIEEEVGPIDILVNNAGIIPRGTILETTDDMWFSALDVNLTAVFFLCRAAIPHMQQAGAGAIVNTSSTWGLYPGPGHVAYCTSKAALAALTKNLARDHAADGIRINAVCPNEVNTPMLRSGFSRRGIDPDNAVAELGKTVPLGHIAEPDEIADVIAFLASQDARYVCGATVEVTGAKAVYG